MAVDFLLAKAESETTMIIFGNDGSAAIPTGTGVNASGNNLIWTYDSNIARGIQYTGVGDEKISKGFAIIKANAFGSDIDTNLLLYAADDSGAVRFDPEGQALLATSDIKVIANGATEQIVEFTFPTPFEPSAGQDIIGAIQVESGAILSLGRSASSVFAYRSDAVIVDPFTPGATSAATIDLYVWFETELISVGPPTLTTPYSDLFNNVGDSGTVALGNNLSGETSVFVEGLPKGATYNNNTGLITYALTHNEQSRITVIPGNSFGETLPHPTFTWFVGAQAEMFTALEQIGSNGNMYSYKQDSLTLAEMDNAFFSNQYASSLLSTGDVLTIMGSDGTKMVNVIVNKQTRAVTLSTGLTIV
jgi:hypothetical protein